MQFTTLDTAVPFDVSETIFDYKYNEGLVHQAVVTYMNNARSGNAAQKTRAEVRGGGRKPWNQKGTGRARAGTSRGPLWRSGGVTFASKKRDYTAKLNKKMYKRAMRSILSELHRQEALVIVSSFQCETVKTKDFLNQMKHLNIDNAFIIMDEVGDNEYLASRNLINFAISDVYGVDPVSLLKYSKVVITQEAVKMLEEQWL